MATKHTGRRYTVTSAPEEVVDAVIAALEPLQPRPAPAPWPQEDVIAAYRYVPETGQWTRADGSEAGWIVKRYHTTQFRGVPVSSSKLIYYHQTGIWAPYGIRHIDGDPENLKWENFAQNTRPMPWTIAFEDEFIARARDDSGKQTTFGRFRTRKEAYAASLLGVTLLRLRGGRGW